MNAGSAPSLQVGAIPVSEQTVIEADVEEQLRSQCPTATPSAGSVGTALLRESQAASASALRHMAVLRIEDVFLAQLHYRAVLLNTGFQNAVLQVCVLTVYVHALRWMARACVWALACVFRKYTFTSSVSHRFHQNLRVQPCCPHLIRHPRGRMLS
jgi:hypothetical protein